MTMDNKFYKSYQTAEWQRLKNKVLERDNYTCQICGGTKGLMQVHHITYKHCNGLAYNAPMGDLITLCQWCHDGDDGDHKHFFNGWFIIVDKGYFGTPDVIKTRPSISSAVWEHEPFQIISLDGVHNVGNRAIGFRMPELSIIGVEEWARFPYLTNIKERRRVWVEDEWCAKDFPDQRLATVDEVIDFFSLIKDKEIEKCLEETTFKWESGDETIFSINRIKYYELMKSRQKASASILKDCSDLMF